MVSLQFEVGPMYMLTHRAQACLCNCTGGLKLFRGVSSLPNGGICLPKFFSYQCANWGTIGWNTSSVGDSSRDRVLCSKVGPRITLCDSYCAPNSKLGRVRSDGSLNNFVRAFVGETIAKTAGAVGSGKESAMAEDNVEDTDVRGRKGRVVIIAGPTGVGKSRLALALAKRLRGEIISADSVQVYRTLDVGSAKTPVDEREGIPHHLIDIVDPSQDYTAGYFYDDARAATELVLTKGSVPIVVGGTGMYLRWYMTGKVGAPKATKEVFVAVEEEVDRLIKEGGGWDDALRMLADAGDLTTGPSLARNDWYRLRRALEIIKTSGQPRSAFSKLRNCDPDAATEGASWDYDFHCYFLYQPRSELYQKVDLRCEQMAQEGLLDEASSLLDSGLQPNSNSASRSIGYQLAMEFLMECRQVEGAATEERFFLFLEEFQRHSRNYVKRQLTWFRNKGQSEQMFNWIDATQPLEVMVDALAKEYERPNEVVSDVLKAASVVTKESSYKEENLLKRYRTQNRIFTSNSEALKRTLQWIRDTQCLWRNSSTVDDLQKRMESSLTTSM
ncbi:tRNA dimethylallyltransferase 9 isoform X1 [Physcomitrium patens]|uniref:tRNA dimethylallyltransferase n=2 Tax=Physcomitrium patens TaxID=3218 RepID=A4ZZA3_PHYPA|nr:tRNA dimethylallyltransferase 9-like isoform X1 [Physcomitrium patens]ABP88738.1 tRNA-isopentenyltransferase [Physcomitrium patens]PNR58499.1 hypothetical protein PHYPA_005494 [Physcomitrium patens]|eukprot:XP_024371763.1 tRNA dimethylallyltransferase 9-like isoform X1 [Physcomitrella patens]